jgi:uncharacterized membrane protein
MTRPFELLKSALVTGLLIVLPAWLALMLLLQLLMKLGVLVKLIASQMPDGINHPQISTVRNAALIQFANSFCFFASSHRLALIRPST